VIGAIAFLGNVILMGVELYTPSGYDLKDLWTASTGGLFDPAAFNSGASAPFWFTIALLIFLTLFYVAYRARNKKAGVNYQTIYTQIPPE
jgi:hypothetical protein